METILKGFIKQCICILILCFCFLCVHAEEFEYPYGILTHRDPLNPLVNSRGEVLLKAKKESPDLFLQGIIYSEKGSAAVINNELFHEGDLFEGYSIEKIERRRVILKKDDKEVILKLEEEE
ncbi:MAG: general secretion pathway protein GspB [Candidatus Omnitrophota bacterium]|nr:MAG: general secretion pathway protein GspB [Candidatus Omnitrophota bacterium]